MYGTLNRNILTNFIPVLLIETVRLGVRAFGGFQNQYSKSVHKPNKACSYFFMYLQKNSIDMYWDPYEYSKQRLIKMKELHSKWGEFSNSGAKYLAPLFLLSKEVEVEWTQKSPSGGENGYPRDNLKASNQIFHWEMACTGWDLYFQTL